MTNKQNAKKPKTASDWKRLRYRVKEQIEQELLTVDGKKTSMTEIIEKSKKKLDYNILAEMIGVSNSSIALYKPETFDTYRDELSRIMKLDEYQQELLEGAFQLLFVANRKINKLEGHKHRSEAGSPNNAGQWSR